MVVIMIKGQMISKNAKYRSVMGNPLCKPYNMKLESILVFGIDTSKGESNAFPFRLCPVGILKVQMLIKSKPRGPFGPLTDYSCDGQNEVFYMAKKRPNSAPQPQKYVLANGHDSRQRRLGVPKKPPACVVKKKQSKRVLSGSQPTTRVTSKYHERCLPHWVPAPGKTIKSSRNADRRESYPLCLVCEYDHSSKEDSIHELYEKFQKGAVQLEELDNQVKSKAKEQKAKVLDALWQMDIEAKKKMEAKMKKKKKSDENITLTENDAPSWKEILQDKQRKGDERNGDDDDQGDNTSSMSIPDGDLKDEKEWSLEDKISKTKAMVHKDNSEVDTKNLNKKTNQTKKKIKKKETLKPSEPKIIKGSPSSKLKKPKKKENKPTHVIVDKVPAAPKGKIVHKIPRPPKSTHGQGEIQNVEGINILTVEQDLDQLPSSRVCSSIGNNDTSIDEDLSLSDSGIKGTQLLLPKDTAKESIDDPIGDWVDQCNVENDFGSNTNPEFMPDNQWKERKANFKREQFKKLYSPTTGTKTSVLSNPDVIKQFVEQEEKELEEASRSDASRPHLEKIQIDQDVFADIIIDELKKENHELKFALVARNQRLEDAASKVAQLVEQNIYLNSKVEKAAFDHTKQVQELIETQKRYEVKIEALGQKLSALEQKRFLEQSALDTSNTDLEATIHELTQKLRKSEESNKNLTIYIDNLKKSYHKVFGNKQDNDKEDHQSSSLSKSLSMQQ